MARNVMSSKFPTGVGTTYNFIGGEYIISLKNSNNVE